MNGAQFNLNLPKFKGQKTSQIIANKLTSLNDLERSLHAPSNMVFMRRLVIAFVLLMDFY